MNDNKILPFPVIPRPEPPKEEEAQKNIRIEEIIERMQERKFKRVLVVGITEDGKPYWDSSDWTAESLIYYLDRLKYRIHLAQDATEKY